MVEYDIEAKLVGRTFTIETKFDLYESLSGNIAIEFHNPKVGKPSGINATKADLWVHVVKDGTGYQAWVARVDKLKEYIRTHKPHRVIDRGGDNNASIYLYRRETLFPAVFRRIDDVPASERAAQLCSMLGLPASKPTPVRMSYVF